MNIKYTINLRVRSSKEYLLPSVLVSLSSKGLELYKTRYSYISISHKYSYSLSLSPVEELKFYDYYE